MDFAPDLVTRERISKLKLTGMEKKFCEVYIEDFDGNRALREAGYTDLRPFRLNKLLGRKSVKEYLDILRAEMLKRVDIKPEDVLKELIKIAFLDMGDLCEWHGNDEVTLKHSVNELTPELRAAVHEISVTETPKGRTVKLKVYNKLEALRELRTWLTELLGKGPPDPGDPARSPRNVINIDKMMVELKNGDVRTAVELLANKFAGLSIPMGGKLRKQIELMTQRVKESSIGDEGDGKVIDGNEA